MAKAKRSSLYAVDQSWQLFVKCDICGLRICVNNNDKRKTQVPRFRNFIVCTDCDPRIIWDRVANLTEAQGARVVHRDRLRIILMAQVVRGLSKFGCLDALGEPGPCKCAGCGAQKLMPPELIGKAIRS